MGGKEGVCWYNKYFCIQLVLTQKSFNGFITPPQRNHMYSNYCFLSFEMWSCGVVWKTNSQWPSPFFVLISDSIF